MKNTETVACEVCLKEIPKSVAHSLEGEDYVYYFCGAACHEKWRAAPGQRDIAIAVDGVDVDFETAETLAKTVAARYAEEPMLLAWSDRRRDEVSPDIPECQHRPGWLAYAESHGGNLKVEINHGEYVFVFRAE